MAHDLMQSQKGKIMYIVICSKCFTFLDTCLAIPIPGPHGRREIHFLTQVKEDIIHFCTNKPVLAIASTHIMFIPLELFYSSFSQVYNVVPLWAICGNLPHSVSLLPLPRACLKCYSQILCGGSAKILHFGYFVLIWWWKTDKKQKS